MQAPIQNVHLMLKKRDTKMRLNDSAPMSVGENASSGCEAERCGSCGIFIDFGLEAGALPADTGAGAGTGFC